MPLSRQHILSLRDHGPKLVLIPLLHAYLAGTNTNDSQTSLSGFSKEAVIQDENKTYTGLAEMEAWWRKTKEEYGTQLEVTGFTGSAERIELNVKCSGTFPGSPVQIPHVFELSEGEINKLVIG